MHTDRHGRAAPGNAAHAGCATATACAARLTPLARHTPWHACWRAAHANMRDTHPRPRLPKYTHIVAERSATARRSSHASKPKNSGGTCRNAKPPPPKKTWSVGAASAALAAQPQPLRSSGRAQHAPSPSRRTSTSRAARVAGAPRARRSRLPATHTPRAQRARARRASHRPSARPCRPCVVAAQGWPRLEQPQGQPQLVLRDDGQNEPQNAAARGWARVLHQRRAAAAAKQLQPHHDHSIGDDEHLDFPNQVDAPPRMRGGSSRAARRRRSRASLRTRPPDRASTGRRKPRPWPPERRVASDAPWRRSLYYVTNEVPARENEDGSTYAIASKVLPCTRDYFHLQDKSCVSTSR